MAEAQRQQFFRNLLRALGPLSEEEKRTQGTFATFEVIKPSHGFVMRSIQVEGAGELQLPLSVADALKLRRVCEQAPFGRGTATLVDPNVRRCWQVDARNVSFPGSPTFIRDTILPLAMRAVRALGIDGAGIQLEAHPYKLLFYEKGGHFTLHRDTERERGMFATLILQMPTADGYTGGELLVSHLNEVKTFDSQMVNPLGFCYTTFFTDCLHELRKIESGTRFCLAFNLVRRDSPNEPILRGLIARRVQKAQAALEPWLNAATAGELNFIGGKLAFPLQHRYTEVNLSFAGLKGDDRILAEVLKNIRDRNNKKWLDLYLCLVTKYQRGCTSAPERYSRRCSDYDSDSGGQSGDECPLSMEDILDEETDFKKWIGEDDRPTSVAWIKELQVDFEKEVVVEEQYDDCPFNDEPDKYKYEGHMGNYGPTLEYWYHTALLVVWPRVLSTSVLCDIGVSDALASLQINDPNFCNQIHQIVVYLEINALNVWKSFCDPKKDAVTPRLLRLCTRAGLYGDVLRILQLLGKPLKSYNQISMIGVRNGEVAKAMATTILVVGWELVSSSVIELVRNNALTQGESFAELAKQLISKGSKEAGELVAKTTFAAFEAHIAQLESKMPPEPVFSWCQPQARLPKHPIIERFLKGRTEKLRINFERIGDARDFRDKYCRTNGPGYSVTGIADGQGRTSFCEIQKTRNLFEAEKGNWCRKQEEVKRFRLELEKLRSAIPKITAGPTVTLTPSSAGTTNTASTVTPALDRSGQRNRERSDEVKITAGPTVTHTSSSAGTNNTVAPVTPALDRSGQRDRERSDEANKRIETSRKVFIDLTPSRAGATNTGTTPPATGRSGQRDRERSDEVSKRAEASPKVFIDLTVNTLPDGSRSKRAKSSSSTIEFIDLTADRDENHGG